MEGWLVDPWLLAIYGLAVYFAFRTLVALMVAHRGRVLAERAARRAAAIAQIEAEESAKREEKKQRRKAG